MSRIDDRPSIKKASQETIYFALGNSIKTRSWLVENEHFRITDNSSSQCNTLPLPSRQGRVNRIACPSSLGAKQSTYSRPKEGACFFIVRMESSSLYRRKRQQSKLPFSIPRPYELKELFQRLRLAAPSAWEIGRPQKKARKSAARKLDRQIRGG